MGRIRLQCRRVSEHSTCPTYDNCNTTKLPHAFSTRQVTEQAVLDATLCRAP